ncbi:phosphonate C-P lyase system protein PhnH [Phyllobacterium brassicacearum]|uniref:Phosphonate C-P lyase system protein PhnH n=1 Tax=Phyllobacterium brassicacearum TaxID=314235 RepID=A0A2P7BTH5_9HYPH|nr:phosphonate C-P lyase system protein PhnH [Phyllobacterium brassicacearum]PSH69783.1 phosphonate C-P lyase system protein PhnH [Phyllobacterium brassicacearum]TDQ34936.1 alpha-D-ribose 1-methylphosphonate 5-triphosphate synthase subunit PhnH [Phyllobacterium brassicacearum]
MRAATQVFEGGFSDAVLNSQEVFRALMDAMANPGLVIPVRDLVNAPAPLQPVMAAIAATLFDHDATVWCDKAIAGSDAATGWLKFQTGLELTSTPSDAQFALIRDVDTMPSFEAFAKGTSEYPDRSTTIILQVAGFDGAEVLTLQGPGIEHTRSFAPSRLPKLFIDQWAANRAAFPRGVDLILAGKGALAALPRTTRVLKREA